MSSPSPKTVLAAASVLAVLVVIQLVVVFTIFIRRAALIGSGPGPKTAVAMVAEVPAKMVPDLPKQPAAPTPKSSPQAAATPAPKPVSSPSGTREVLVERSREAREKGDMTSALAGLREAQNLAPDDPLIVSEMAITYEKMGLVDKALNQWKRVVDFGEKSGDLYGIAAEKLKNGIGKPVGSGIRDEDGLQPGTTLGFADLQKTYAEVAPGQEQVDLRVAIKARPSATVFAGDVNTQMAFYDLVNNQEVEQTDARVTWNWVTSPPDWQDDRMEVLKIQYARDAQSATDRKYLGYIVRVYYKNELQDVRAEPIKLLQYFPPQVTLQSEIPQ